MTVPDTDASTSDPLAQHRPPTTSFNNTNPLLVNVRAESVAGLSSTAAARHDENRNEAQHSDEQRIADNSMTDVYAASRNAASMSDPLPAHETKVIPEEDTGWSAMQKTVRDYDLEKIKAHQKHIDTLLVFAGLYSAVLAAFAAISLQFLLPDRAAETVELLRELVSQHSETSLAALQRLEGHGKRASAVTETGFAAPAWAIRVNVLWVASLIMSLSTASFAIFVKQWLGEYLAMDYISPQERLRARQYRSPAMKSWHIFHIVTILPLLLQLSLGLFFTGLCYFTFAYDRQLGLTTLPLVCGWAFLITATSLLPLFSPRCPFKTPLLDKVMLAIRQLCPFLPKFGFILAYGIRSAYRKGISPLSGNKANIKWPPSHDEITSAIEEEGDVIVAHKHHGDTEVLLSVDGILPGNGLLSTIIEAFKQQGPLAYDQNANAEQVIRFAVILVVHRVGPVINSITDALYPQTHKLPMNLLSYSDWHCLVPLITGAMQDYYVEGDPAPAGTKPPSWLLEALLLLLYPTRFSLPRVHTEIVKATLQHSYDNERRVFCAIIGPAVECARNNIRASGETIFSLITYTFPAAIKSKMSPRGTPVLHNLRDRGIPDNALAEITRASVAAVQSAITPSSTANINRHGSANSTSPKNRMNYLANVILLLFSGDPALLVSEDIQKDIKTWNFSSRLLPPILYALLTPPRDVQLVIHTMEPSKQKGTAAPFNKQHPETQIHTILRFLSLYGESDTFQSTKEAGAWKNLREHVPKCTREALAVYFAGECNVSVVKPSWAFDTAVIISSAIDLQGPKERRGTSTSPEQLLQKLVLTPSVLHHLLKAMLGLSDADLLEACDPNKVIDTVLQLLRQIGVQIPETSKIPSQQENRVIMAIPDLWDIPSSIFVELMAVTTKVLKATDLITNTRLLRTEPWAANALGLLLSVSQHVLPKEAETNLHLYLLNMDISNFLAQIIKAIPDQISRRSSSLSRRNRQQQLHNLPQAVDTTLSRSSHDGYDLIVKIDQQAETSRSKFTQGGIAISVSRKLISILLSNFDPEISTEQSASWYAIVTAAAQVLGISPSEKNVSRLPDSSAELAAFPLLITPASFKLPSRAATLYREWLSKVPSSPDWVSGVAEHLASISDPAQIVVFVIRAINFFSDEKTSSQLPEQKLQSIPSRQQYLKLPSNLRYILPALIGQTVNRYLHDSPSPSHSVTIYAPSWVLDAAIILLSDITGKTQNQVASRGPTDVLRKIFQTFPMIAELIGSLTGTDHFVPLSAQLAPICIDKKMLRNVLKIYVPYLLRVSLKPCDRWVFEKVDDHNHSDVSHPAASVVDTDTSMKYWSSGQTTVEAMKGLKDPDPAVFSDLLGLLTTCKNRTKLLLPVRLAAITEYINLQALQSRSTNDQSKQNARSSLVKLFLETWTGLGTCTYFFRLGALHIEDCTGELEWLHSVNLDSAHNNDEAVCQCLTQSISQLQSLLPGSDEQNHWLSNFGAVDFVRLCDLFLTVNDVSRTRERKFDARWRELWDVFSERLKEYYEREDWKTPTHDEHMKAGSSQSSGMPEPNTLAARHAQLFRDDQSMAESMLRNINAEDKIPDALILSLGRFIPDENVHSFDRLNDLRRRIPPST